MWCILQLNFPMRLLVCGYFQNKYIDFHLNFVTYIKKNKNKNWLTNNSLISSWMINIIVSCRYWVLKMLSDGIHLSLTCSNQMFMLVLQWLWSFVILILWHLHTLFLKIIHSWHCILLLSLKHLLQLLLFSNWTQGDVSIYRIVILLLMGEHFSKAILYFKYKYKHISP